MKYKKDDATSEIGGVGEILSDGYARTCAKIGRSSFASAGSLFEPEVGQSSLQAHSIPDYATSQREDDLFHFTNRASLADCRLCA